MDVQPIILTGRVIRLEPLAAVHDADLYALTQDTPDIYQYMTVYPTENSLAAFTAYRESLLKRPNMVFFAMVTQAENRAVGMTSYMDIRPNDRGLEIGSTWISVPYQGTAVNPEVKYLMLRHAFEKLGAIRVQLKTDGRNLHSQKAIEKLGATKEGILRKHYILPDGYQRDSVMYSILDTEWESVKARLEARLGYALEV